ncbi:MAG: glutamine synthetase [Elusimicrobia bacterium]|nr:glutamine synthetase [Elusimicrobiota bacterium]
MIRLKELLTLIGGGEIDTVLLVFPDMQGRWMGKRLTGRFFAQEAASHGVHACAYLLTVDMEMNPTPGYELTSWEKGYGDFHMIPDFRTIRRLPWLEKSALIVCDLEDSQGRPIAVAPRTILKRQIARARERGFQVKTASELEFYLFRESYESAKQKKFHGLENYGHYIEDYHMLQGTREEPVVGEIRRQMEAAGVPVEASKGEWGPGQHEINLGYAEALEMADRHLVYKHGAKEIAMGKGCSLTFMAKFDAALAGSSFHLHSSLWDASGRRPLFWDAKKGAGSKLFQYFLGGQLALASDFSVFYAPSINSYKRYQASTFAPTRIAWAQDNRTCGFRIVGAGGAFRIENRIPGADANPYLAFAATIAAGLYGIERRIDPPKELKGNAYAAQAARVPTTLQEALAAFADSEPARAAFDDAVVRHYAHAAETEWDTFGRAVTCWELDRYFERI